MLMQNWYILFTEIYLPTESFQNRSTAFVSKISSLILPQTTKERTKEPIFSPDAEKFESLSIEDSKN